MTTPFETLEALVRLHIDVRSDTHGIALALRDYFEEHRSIDQDSLFSCRIADLMTSIGILAVNDEGSSAGYHAYTWTKEARRFYDILRNDGYYDR